MDGSRGGQVMNYRGTWGDMGGNGEIPLWVRERGSVSAPFSNNTSIRRLDSLK